MRNEQDSDVFIRAVIDTVTGVADHYRELRERVLDAVHSIRASERGYFTPSEDDLVRGIQFAWWTSRNALFELVSSASHLHTFPRAHRPAALLTAFSGALVLVDAARFLREQFHDRPVARARLNEAAPQLGLPANLYESVQKSLTRPVHAWHLYHAGQYLRQHRDELPNLTRQWPGLRQLAAIVARLQHRLRVTPADYAVARIRVRGRGLQRGGLGLLERAAYGVQKAVSELVSGRYVRPGHVPQIPPLIARQLSDTLRPGDILVTRKNHALTNYFLPGYWPHAALCLGSVRELRALNLHNHEAMRPRWARLLSCDVESSQRVLEALKDGHRIRSVTSPLSSDAVTVIRPQLDRTDIATALARGLIHEGKPYDFNFDFSRADRLVCTEVIYRSFEGLAGIGFALTRRAGRLTLSAEDLLRKALRREQFSIHCLYAPPISGTLLYGAPADAALRRTGDLS